MKEQKSRARYSNSESLLNFVSDAEDTRGRLKTGDTKKAAENLDQAIASAKKLVKNTPPKKLNSLLKALGAADLAWNLLNDIIELLE